MGHRALVAYERTNGQYTLHYSHWGAANLKLKHRITAETPFGGEGTDSTWAKQLLAELADGLETARSARRCRPLPAHGSLRLPFASRRDRRERLASLTTEHSEHAGALRTARARSGLK